MRFSKSVTIIGASLACVLVVAFGALVLRPPVALVSYAEFEAEEISPNADGEGDLTRFRYELTRNADIWLDLIAEDGTSYVFRSGEARLAGEYSVLFSGVVNGFTYPDETDLGTVERRLIPNGNYTWRFRAQEADGQIQTLEGRLTIRDADSPLPVISSFTLAPSLFSPNQDGVDDRVEINVYLQEPADLRVFLIGESGVEIPISARKEGRLAGEAGRHIFDYEGGIDLGAEPPADGTYRVVAIAQDAEGQRTRRESQLSIRNGGKPLAEIVAQAVGVDVVFSTMPYDERYFSDEQQLGERIPMPADSSDLSLSTITMPIGDMLVFKLTIENYNEVPIRTTFPPPGTVYQQDQVAASLGAFDESGAWRVGIQCETSKTSFPYRWAVGSPEDLIQETDERGRTFYYLPPKARSVVWGAIRLTELQQRQNPQNCWAGLIHEDVEVSLRNSYVGPREVELVDPSLPNGGN